MDDHICEQIDFRILSALRGPDSGDLDLKNATTSVIRWFALQKAPHLLRGMYLHADICSPTDSRAMLKPEMIRTRVAKAWQEAGGHFRNHVKRAFITLGQDNREASIYYWDFLVFIVWDVPSTMGQPQ